MYTSSCPLRPRNSSKNNLQMPSKGCVAEGHTYSRLQPTSRSIRWLLRAVKELGDDVPL